MTVTGWSLSLATNTGIQILDQLGRVNAILPMPPGGQPSNLCFGGSGFDVLYVSAVGKVWRRAVEDTGCNPFEVPVRTRKGCGGKCLDQYLGVE